MNLVVKKWFANFKKYFFTFKDGFFELPYLANSPEMMIESFSSMPFMNDDRKRGCFSSSNMFLKGDGHYQKIEEGLWIIMSSFEVKRNISFKLHYDPTEPSDYHFLTLYIDKGSRTIKLPKLELNIENQDRSWILYKAGKDCLNSHFKGQKSIYFSIYFSQNWLEQNIASNGSFKNSYLNAFFQSNQDYIYLPNLLDYKREVYENIVASILNKDENGVKNLLDLKVKTYDIIHSFVEALAYESKQIVNEEISERDRRRVLKAQHILHDAIFSKFPSIQFIADKVGVSETKIKADFKKIMGVSMHQYFVQKQMTYACELLKNKDLKIKDIANTLSYASPSKFTEAFKSQLGLLPSEYLQA